MAYLALHLRRAGTETSPYENTTVGEALRGFPFQYFTLFNRFVGIKPRLLAFRCPPLL
jgi:hypothetical protein